MVLYANPESAILILKKNLRVAFHTLVIEFAMCSTYFYKPEYTNTSYPYENNSVLARNERVEHNISALMDRLFRFLLAYEYSGIVLVMSDMN